MYPVVYSDESSNDRTELGGFVSICLRTGLFSQLRHKRNVYSNVGLVLLGSIHLEKLPDSVSIWRVISVHQLNTPL